MSNFGGYVGIIDITIILLLGFLQDHSFDKKLIKSLYSTRPEHAVKDKILTDTETDQK